VDGLPGCQKARGDALAGVAGAQNEKCHARSLRH
jgi:hypothetical protein